MCTAWRVIPCRSMLVKLLQFKNALFIDFALKVAGKITDLSALHPKNMFDAVSHWPRLPSGNVRLVSDEQFWNIDVIDVTASKLPSGSVTD